MAKGWVSKFRRASISASERLMFGLMFGLILLANSSRAEDSKRNPSASSTPTVAACEAIRRIQGKALTGYSTISEDSESVRPARYRKVFLEDSSIHSGAPNGLLEREKRLIQGVSIKYLSRYIKAHPSYPGIDIRIASTTKDCGMAIISMERDPKGDGPVHPLSARYIKNIKYRIEANDPESPMSIHLVPLEETVDGLLDINYTKLPSYAYVGPTLDLYLGAIDDSIEFVFSDLMPLQLELPSHLMAKPLINEFRIRFHWSSLPEGDTNWVSPKITEVQAALSREDRDRIKAMTFTKFRH